MKSFEFNNTTYELINFDEKATVRMEMVANSILMGALGKLSEGTTISLKQLSKMTEDSNPVIDAMALVYWEEGKEKFTKSDWEKRRELFLDLPKSVKDDCAKELEGFLGGIGRSLQGDFQIFNGLNEPKKTEGSKKSTKN